jgi:flavodoxin
MNALIIYESQFGNTEQIARSVAHALAQRGSVRLEPIERADPLMFEGADLLLLGSPTQHHDATPDMLACLDHIPPQMLAKLAVAVFDTRYHIARVFAGSAAHVIAKEVQQRGGRLIAPPESFFVTNREGPLEAGEVERAASWAGTLADALVAPTVDSDSLRDA